MSIKSELRRKDDAMLECSFCGQSQAAVKKIIAGPGVYICDQCVVLCVEIIAPSEEEKAQLVARSRTQQPPAPDDDPGT